MLSRYGFSQSGRVLVLGVSFAIVVALFLTHSTSIIHAQTTTFPPSGKIAGVVYVDLNGNGIQDNGEPGVANVGITVLHPGTSVIAFYVLTGPDGTYEVGNLLVGTYTVFGSAPEGFGIAPMYQSVAVTDGAAAIANFRLYPVALWMPQINKRS